MALRDFLRNLWVGAPPPAAVASPKRDRVAASDAPSRTSLAGGRVSVDTTLEGMLFGQVSTILAPNSAEQDWRRFDLDSDTLARVSATRLAELLADLSPDISRALWDLVLMINPGWEANALRPGTDEVDPIATAALSDFLQQLTGHYGAIDVVFARLTIAAFLRGSFCAELVLDETGRLPIDLATPDPATVLFERAFAQPRGVVWRPFQWQGGQKVYLDVPTIGYVPIHPFPGSPYGRPMVAPAIFSTLFLLGLLHDLRRVVAQQGWPRIDVEVDMQQLRDSMPPDLLGDPQAQQTWLDAAITAVQGVFRSLAPEDTYVHPSLIKVNRPVGTVDSSSLGAVDGIITALERMSVRALKTMPLLLGSTDGTSEANANRQWELYAAGIKSLQHYLEALLERLLGLALQVQGIQATVQFRFSELRAAELFRDAQTERLQVLNASTRYLAGWISQDQAAQQGAGVAKADVPEPRAPISQGAPPAPGNPDLGANRARRGNRRSQATEKVIPLGASDPLLELPDKVEFTAADRKALWALWDETMDEEHRGLLDAEVVP